MPPPSAPTIQDAESAIRARFKAGGAQIDLRYDASKVIETERWWYFPCSWIGCSGQIVDKRDLYVDWLGSALSLDDCFWGHERGIVCDDVDFTFTDEVEAEAVTIRRLVARFQHYIPKRSKPSEEFLTWYSEAELDQSIITQYPTFRRHFVWFAIPELRGAVESRSISFNARRSKTA